MKHKEYALIVAGGKGTRIQSELPKQFLELDGKPILLRTIEAFKRYSEAISIILVLPEIHFTTWESIQDRFKVNGSITLQAGGETRFQSVKNGLALLPDEGLVAIHDGVRPLVGDQIIAHSFRLAALHGSAVASVNLKESIRWREAEIFRSMDRTKFRIIQTPQTFDLGLIKKAYQQKENPAMTDDASVFETDGHPVTLFEGSFRNIKVTTKEDLVVAKALLEAEEGE